MSIYGASVIYNRKSMLVFDYLFLGQGMIDDRFMVMDRIAESRDDMCWENCYDHHMWYGDRVTQMSHGMAFDSQETQELFELTFRADES